MLVIFAMALLLNMPNRNREVACTSILVVSRIVPLSTYVFMQLRDVLFLTQLWKSFTDFCGSCVPTFTGKFNLLLSVFVRASKLGGYNCFSNIHEKPPLSSMSLMYGFSQRTANTGVIPRKPHISSLMSTSFLSSIEMVFFTSTPMVNLPEQCSAIKSRLHLLLPYSLFLYFLA